jgi:hypothetical protein
MRKRVLLHVVLVAMLSSPAMGGTLYRCENGGRVSYGDRACDDGIATRVQAATPPSMDEQKSALARLRQGLVEFDARWTARVAAYAAATGTAANRRPRSAAAAAGDRETYCFERHDGADATPTIRVTRHVTMSAIVRN